MQWLGLVGIGLLIVSAQSLFLVAIRRGDASFVAPLFYATLVFAAVYDFAIFNVIPSALSNTGAGIIILGALLMRMEREAACAMIIVSSLQRSGLGPISFTVNDGACLAITAPPARGNPYCYAPLLISIQIPARFQPAS